MNLKIHTGELSKLKADAVVIFNEKGKVALRGIAADINKHLDGKLGELIETEEFGSNQDQFLYFFSFEKFKVPRIGLAGFDMDKERTLNPLRSAAAKAVKSLRDAGIKKVLLAFDRDEAGDRVVGEHR